MKYIALILVLVAIAGLAYIRFAPMGPEWHADPADGARTGNPNDVLIGPGGDREAIAVAEAPEALMARLDAIVMAEGATVIGGSVGEGHITYVQRTPLMGYPDAMSVRVVADGKGSKLMIWSRSRFGQSDFGVNQSRIDRWLGALSL